MGLYAKALPVNKSLDCGDTLNAVEAFFDRGWDEAGSHQVEDAVRYYAWAPGVTGFADGEGYVEPEGFDSAMVLVGDIDPGLAVLAGQVGGVDVRNRAAQFDSVSQKSSRDFENSGVDGLIRFIVDELAADSVGGDGIDVVLLKPRGLSRTGQAHGNHDVRQRSGQC
jgi:hypothetical protein